LTEFEETITDALGDTLTRCGLPANISSYRLPAAGTDSASIFVVGETAPMAILAVSPEEFPDLVSVEQEKASRMKSVLGPELGSPIVVPITEGTLDNSRSYALLPRKTPLSDNRIVWPFQRRSLKAHLARWLREINATTTTEGASFELYQDSLEHLCKVAGLSGRLRSVAQLALARLLAGDFIPRVTPMHNDLWKGNVLLPSGNDNSESLSFPFFIIDWRGSRVDGFPLFDLVRLSMSLKFTASELRQELAQSCQSIGCEFSDAPYYVATALGEISSRNDQFPMQAFLGMAEHCFAELRKAGSLI
jgi:hypothetical protein